MQAQQTKSRVVLDGVRPLTTFRERLTGLLGTTEQAEPVLITHCDSIHTFGMNYPLDVAFVSEEGIVLETRRLWPGKVAHCPNGSFVLEWPAGQGAWLKKGDKVALALLGEQRSAASAREEDE